MSWPQARLLEVTCWIWVLWPRPDEQMLFFFRSSHNVAADQPLNKMLSILRKARLKDKEMRILML